MVVKNLSKGFDQSGQETPIIITPTTDQDDQKIDIEIAFIVRTKLRDADAFKHDLEEFLARWD